MVTIYSILCTPTGMRYVGCTEGNINKRMREHRCLLNKKRHYSAQMSDDWHKYGESAFMLSTLEQFEGGLVERREAELKWLKHFDGKNELYNKVQAFAPRPDAIRKGVEASRHPDVIARRVATRRKNRPNKCRRGHEFDEANTIINNRGARVCRACKLASSRRHEAKKKVMI